MIAAVVTARAGSQSIPGKNILPIGGKPCIVWQIEAAQRSGCCDGGVYVSSNGRGILEVAAQSGAIPILRPDEISTASSHHHDAIAHAATAIDDILRGQLSVLVVLLGNTVMVSPEDVSAAVELLQSRPDADSVMTVWRAADDHPMRALTLEGEFLVPYPDRERRAPTNRQEYPPVYYYDNGLWVVRKHCVFEKDGVPNPWSWMGKKCLPIVRDWVTGRDIHGPLDVAVSEWWVAR